MDTPVDTAVDIAVDTATKTATETAAETAAETATETAADIAGELCKWVAVNWGCKRKRGGECRRITSADRRRKSLRISHHAEADIISEFGRVIVAL